MIKTRWNIQLTGMFFAHRVSHNKAHHLWAGEVLSCDTCLRPHCTLSHHHFWWGEGKEKCKFSLPDTVGLYAFNPRNRKQYSKEDDHSQKKMILLNASTLELICERSKIESKYKKLGRSVFFSMAQIYLLSTGECFCSSLWLFTS